MPQCRHKLAIVLAVSVAGAWAAVPIAALASAPSATPAPAAQAISGDDALDNAVAAVLVSALGQQFPDEPVSLRIDSIDVRIASQRDRVVSGAGRMRLGNDPEWIGFRYRTLYDVTFGNAGYPELTLGGIGDGEREVPNDAALIQQIETRVIAELDKSLAPGARLQLDRISTVEAGRRFLRIDASGTADFGLQGATPIRIDSLYDTRAADWKRVQYQLGASGTP